MSEKPETIQVKTVDHPETARRLEVWDRINEAARTLFINKNTQYDDAIAETGVLGAVVEIVGLKRRLRAMVIQKADHGKGEKSALSSLLLDLYVYAAIALMMISDDNWTGE